MKIATLGVKREDFMVAMKLWGNSLASSGTSDRCSLAKITGASKQAPVFSRSRVEFQSVMKYMYSLSDIKDNANTYRYSLSSLQGNTYKYSLKDLTSDINSPRQEYRYSLSALGGSETFRYSLSDLAGRKNVHRYTLSSLTSGKTYSYALSSLSKETYMYKLHDLNRKTYNYILSSLAIESEIYSYNLTDLSSSIQNESHPVSLPEVYKYSLSALLEGNSSVVSTEVHSYILSDLIDSYSNSDISEEPVDSAVSDTPLDTDSGIQTTDISLEDTKVSEDTPSGVSDAEVDTVSDTSKQDEHEDTVSEVVDLSELMQDSANSNEEISQDDTSDSQVTTISSSEVALEIPADIVDFLKKYPDHSSISEVERYYSKKDIALALRTGRILKRKNKYRI